MVLPAAFVHKHYFKLAQQVARGETTPEQAADRLLMLWLVEQADLDVTTYGLHGPWARY